jgi:hypothetical protein
MDNCGTERGVMTVALEEVTALRGCGGARQRQATDGVISIKMVQAGIAALHGIIYLF